MGQLALPGPKSVLKVVESCVILTKLFLRAREVQEREEIPDISWQMDHSTRPMIEPIQARQRLMGQLACPKVCNRGNTMFNYGGLQKRKLGQKHLGNNGTLFKGSRSDDINDEVVGK